MKFFWWCVILAVAAMEDVVIERIEPDPATQEFPCPHQIVQYKCQTLISTASLTWRLSSGDTLPEFSAGSSVGRVRNSSDDQFSATLTGKMEDDDPDTDLFFFTSTLLILEPINGSSLTCIASVGGSLSQGNTTIVLSGSPDSPTSVTYNELVVIVSSVELQWMRPSYTGSRGVSVMNYTVTANGETVVVSDDSEVVSYTSPSLIYGDVLVTAVNSCGQKSGPSLLNIPVSEPTQLVEKPREVFCNEALENGRRVLVEWMVGSQEPGVVYPGEVEVSVELDPACLNEDSTSCTATIGINAVYQVTITQTNRVGATTNNCLSFDPSPLDKDSGTIGSSVSVNITIQQLCKVENYTIVLCLGHKKASDEECDFTGGDRLEKENVQPGVPQVFNISDSTLTLSSGDVYCYTASLLSAGDKCDISSYSGSSLSAAGIAGIVIAVLIVLLTVVVMTLLLMWTLKRNFRPSSTCWGGDATSTKRNGVVPSSTDYSEDKATTERAGGSVRSLKGCVQWFTEHFKRGNTSRSEVGDDTGK